MLRARFRLLATTAALLVGCLPLATALSEYDTLAIVNEFAENFIAPNNLRVAQGINSTLFSEDVYGTADVSTNFDGRELSTPARTHSEYLFGLFVETANDPTDPSPFGSPISYNVTAAVVEHQTIATSVKFEFWYDVLNRSFPIQIDAYFLVNDQGEISQYDVSFRRWAWATDVIIPLLIPYMADRINTTSTNATFVLQQYASDKVCRAAVQNCNGTNLQYDNYDDCMSFLAAKPIGEWYRMGEDNLLCRQLHVPMVPLRPDVHCPHIGPSGGDMCIPRDYDQVVLESHFPIGWLAPKYITAENADEVSSIEATNNVP
ncbi:hypothetical protein JCM24511_01261 [Saitozyma sp. JCM 24511]|nr:hypothetical protein JCM24511_01261 [Saitozyma sp. JCM 24511]